MSPDTRISFDDYERMQIYEHHRSQSPAKTLPTPEWALNDRMLREVIIAFIENRAQLRPGAGTVRERLTQAIEGLRNKAAKIKTDLDWMQLDYVTEPDSKRKRRLQIEIENYDTQLRILERPAVLAMIPYLYYRVPMGSVGVAEQVGLRPPHVRQILFRMNEIAEELNQRKKIDIARAEQLRASGMTLRKIARELGTGLGALHRAMHREPAW